MSGQTVVQFAESQGGAAASYSYPPSWVDRLVDWIDRLPGPPWAAYVVMSLLLIIGYAAIQWASGAYPIGTFHRIHVFLGIGIPFTLALLHYLDRYTDAAFTRFRPALDAPPGYERLLRFQLTTMPVRPVWVATLAGIGMGSMGFLIPYPQRLLAYGFADNLPSAVLYNVLYIVFWIVTAAFIYHTFHQLRLINVIFRRYTRINLFQRRPMYGLAWISAYTAIFGGLWTISAVALVATTAPFLDQTSVMLQFISSYALLPLIPITFITPLWGVHRLLVAEKERMLDENMASVEGALQDLRQHLVARDLDECKRVNDLMGSLELEARVIRQIPTWPWQPEAPRTVIATILIPIGIWLVQRLLDPALR